MLLNAAHQIPPVQAQDTAAPEQALDFVPTDCGPSWPGVLRGFALPSLALHPHRGLPVAPGPPGPLWRRAPEQACGLRQPARRWLDAPHQAALLGTPWEMPVGILKNGVRTPSPAALQAPLRVPLVRVPKGTRFGAQKRAPLGILTMVFGRHLRAVLASECQVATPLRGGVSWHPELLTPRADVQKGNWSCSGLGCSSPSGSAWPGRLQNQRRSL